ncbi:MAG TPA: 3-isopropylmalate dehydrogenase [Deltaproteobacteria bacterium]|nr:3-isopropylmalate dehydrogenase [Deltaproteobacteria bacterium]
MPKILVLSGDGIGPEVMDETLKILSFVDGQEKLGLEFEKALVGGCSYDAYGRPLTEATLRLAEQADAVLLGAVGGPRWEALDYSLRPERALLALRSELGLFANLRPAKVYPALVGASSLKPEVIEGIDIMVLRELTGDIYFGTPKGVEKLPNGEERGINTMVYTTHEIERIAKLAFEIARGRRKKISSIDKANVLETTELWRKVVTRIGAAYPDVELKHMYVDNCAMQLVRYPKQFDVIVTGNLFGDILSDEAAMLTGSIGMLPSASLAGSKKGMYEPIHGSAPDIAGRGVANPIATILSGAMMLDLTFGKKEAAQKIERAVEMTLEAGLRTADLAGPHEKKTGTQAAGAAILAELKKMY